MLQEIFAELTDVDSVFVECDEIACLQISEPFLELPTPMKFWECFLRLLKNGFCLLARYTIFGADQLDKECDLTAENNVRNAVEVKLNPRGCEDASKNGYFFAIRFKPDFLKLLFNRLFSFKRGRRDWLFHNLYERQKRGLLLSPLLRSFERNPVLTGLGNARDFSFNGRLEQEKGDKPKDEGYSGPNEEVGHVSMANSYSRGPWVRTFVNI